MRDRGWKDEEKGNDRIWRQETKKKRKRRRGRGEVRRKDELIEGDKERK